MLLPQITNISFLHECVGEIVYRFRCFEALDFPLNNLATKILLSAAIFNFKGKKKAFEISQRLLKI